MIVAVGILIGTALYAYLMFSKDPEIVKHHRDKYQKIVYTIIWVSFIWWWSGYPNI